MPDAQIVRVMASFRRQVQSGEDAAVQRMAQGWLAVERRLQDSAELTARIILDEQRAGRPVTRSMLLRNERFLDLLAQTRAEVNRYIPEAERIIRGQQQALASLGVEHASTAIQTISANAQFNRLPTMAVQNMIGLAGDGSPLRTLLQNSYSASADGILDEMVKGVALGKGPVAIARAIVRQGLSRSLDRMIVVNRTEGLRVYRQATLDSYRASGIVSGYLRIAAKSPRTCVGCLMADHRFFPLTVPFEEHVQGRCLTPGTIVSGPKAISFVSRYYVGDVIEITTASGNFLSVTPNHPVLTDGGWIAAHLLKEGDNVIGSGVDQGIAAGMNPDEYQVPTAVENVPRALNMYRLAVMPATAQDFHGDGSGSEVYIVWANRFLGNALNGALLQPLPEHNFGIRSMSGASFAGLGDIAHVLKSMFLPTSRFLGAQHTLYALFGGHAFSAEPVSIRLVSPLNIGNAQAHSDNLAGDSIGDSQSVLGFTGNIPSGNFINGERRARESIGSSLLAFYDFPVELTPEQPTGFEFIREALIASVKSSSRYLRTIAGNIRVDRILKINRVGFSGHVYNLQTQEQWYIANGIITHNCTAVPAVDGAPMPSWKTGADWFVEQPAATQREMLGPGRYDAWKADKFDLGALVTVRQDATWGNSVVPTPLRELVG